jgi:hypothetical protein
MFKKLLITITSLVGIGWGSFSQAGWNSGGGELFSDAQNPWFVENTREVKYCIEIDETNFGADFNQVRRNVAAAFGYWRDHFARRPTNAINGLLNIRIGTQTFLESVCTEDIDIKFQAGTLTSDQSDFLRNPRQVIASAVRTEYDTVNLRGRGFIYVSPEYGPLALAGIGSSSGYKILPRRWSHARGKVLEQVLIHELGHVFGFRHADHSHIMASWAPEGWVSDFSASFVTEDSPWPLFELSFDRGMLCESYCFSGPYEHLFGVPQQGSPIEVNFDPATRIFRFRQRNHSGQYIEFGRTGPAKVGGTHTPVLFVYVTPDQRVFPVTVPQGGSAAVSSSVQLLSATAIYYSGSVTREIKFDWAAGFLSLNTIENNTYIDGAAYLSVDWRR